jgi:hypothetical protein
VAAHVWGAIVGAGLITILKQWLQDWLPKLLGQSGNFEVIVFGMLMILVLQRARDGVWPILMRLLSAVRCRACGARGRPAGATPAAGIAGTLLLEVTDASKRFGGLVANDTGELHGEGRRSDGADRPQRGRQEHDVQRHLRRRSADFRRYRLSRRTHRVLAGAPASPAAA